MWELNNERPIYLQLVEKIKTQIISGEYKAGDKLESVRDLAMVATVNPNTMQKALTVLEQEGLVFSQRTAGRYITEDNQKIANLKTDEATSVITQFLNQMEKLGITNEEVIKLIENLNKNKVK